MHIGKTILAVIAAGAAAATVGAGTAMAAPRPHLAPEHHALAAVELLSGGNEQYAVVNAESPRGPLGSVDYTNFSYPAHSNVWSLAGGPETLTVHALGNVYSHTLNGGEILKALSNNDVNFKGTGYYNPVPSDNWSVAGNIHGNNVIFTVTYGSWAVPAYSAVDQGKIAADGSASGTFKDSANVTGTWSLPAGTFRTVLHYVAPVLRDSESVFPHHAAEANVQFRIPFGNPFAGTRVSWDFGYNRFGVKNWSQGVNGGPQGAETVEAGLIAIS